MKDLANEVAVITSIDDPHVSERESNGNRTKAWEQGTQVARAEASGSSCWFAGAGGLDGPL